MNPETIRQEVRAHYGRAITARTGCCGPTSSCDSPRPDYSASDLAPLPPDAVASSFGCGNPLAMAGLRAGQVVVDIGSGAGLDALLAARAVGPEGRVIGIDMTPEMLAKARAHAVQAGAKNVEFRLGEAEHMPVADASVDWILSNCVINLSPEKPRVFAEAFRILKAGGRVSVADILVEDLPEPIRRSTILHSACISGAVSEHEYLGGLRAAGFVGVQITDRQVYDRATVLDLIAADPNLDPTPLFPGLSLEEIVDRHVVGKIASVRVVAEKPRIEAARDSDGPAIERLLRASDLPLDGSERAAAFLVARGEDDSLLATGALEGAGPVRLLRSVAVTSRQRGAGYGQAMTRALEALASAQGVTELWLLTTTADAFFAARGYRSRPRTEAPDVIRTTLQFRETCPESAVLMMKRI